MKKVIQHRFIQNNFLIVKQVLMHTFGLKKAGLIKHLFLLAISLSFNYSATSQGMLVSGSAGTADPSAMLEVQSSSLGMLVPRMTTTQRDNIASPATGLVIYNTTTNKFNYYNGSWIDIVSSSDIIPVANGGTGVSTTTAYGVITGGTTATGAFQNAGTGTSGQVLTSQGSGSLPIWANLSGNLLNMQVFATNGTYTPTTGTTKALFILVGGGGGGGGATVAGTSKAGGIGGSAGSGTVLYQYAAISDLVGGTGSPISFSVTIGAGGSGGSAGNNAGTDGGSTSIGGMVSPGGIKGIGGASSTIFNVVPGGAGGGVPTTVNGTSFYILGNNGGDGVMHGNTNQGPFFSGEGGSGPFGSGGNSAFAYGAANITDNGNSAIGYGAGGSGAACGSAGTAGSASGGNGAPGVIIIYEYK